MFDLKSECGIFKLVIDNDKADLASADIGNAIPMTCLELLRGDQIFFSATCPGQVASKNPLVLRNFSLVPKYFSNCISFGQVANTTISYSECNSNQTEL